MSPSDMACEMGQGNPGGLTVVANLIREGDWITVLNLDDMNMRGSQIWVAYKDFAKGDLKVLAKAAQERNREMVDLVNTECPEQEPAVKSGASFR